MAVVPSRARAAITGTSRSKAIRYFRIAGTRPRLSRAPFTDMPLAPSRHSQAPICLRMYVAESRAEIEMGVVVSFKHN